MNRPREAQLDQVQKRLQDTGAVVERDALLSAHTRFAIGGPAVLLVRCKDGTTLAAARTILVESGIPCVVIGGGTNLLVSDGGYPGAVLRLENDRLRIDGEAVEVDAGVILQDLVDATVAQGLSGLESMTGIPGTVGGAIYGNAGAYGHSIAERVRFVRVIDGGGVREISRADCCFRYRESVFKQNKDWLIISASLGMGKGDAAALSAVAGGILDTRNRKYPPSMKCAGSIFKNFLLAELPDTVKAEVPDKTVIEGKVPSAWFLESIGAKGMRCGDICVATYHANLLYNDGIGTARDAVALIDELKRRVRERWRIDLQEEVQYVGFDV